MRLRIAAIETIDQWRIHTFRDGALTGESRPCGKLAAVQHVADDLSELLMVLDNEPATVTVDWRPLE